MVCDRPLLVQAGLYDASFPAADTLGAYERVQNIYRAAGVENRLSLDLFDGVHEMNSGPILEWFARWLAS